MNTSTKASVFTLRLAMGWLFFYAGITKVLNPEWSAEGYLQNAKTFTGLYQWFASANNIEWVNLLNEWGLTLIGVSLILGAFVRCASLGGILLMALYYLPVLDFPYPNLHSYLVDDHIIYLLVFVVLYTSRAGQYWGIDAWLHKRGVMLGQ